MPKPNGRLRRRNLEKDVCGNVYCGNRTTDNEFYCDWCKSMMKKSVYGNYKEWLIFHIKQWKK